MSRLEEIGNAIAASFGTLAESATLTRGGADYACTAIVENADRTAQNMLAVDERVVIVLGLAVEPKPRDVLTVGSKRLSVQRSASAAMNACWRVIVKG